MSDNKLVEGNEKIAAGLSKGFNKISDGVVCGYKKIENGAVNGYTKIEDRFVGKFLAKDGESITEAKERLRTPKK